MPSPFFAACFAKALQFFVKRILFRLCGRFNCRYASKAAGCVGPVAAWWSTLSAASDAEPVLCLQRVLPVARLRLGALPYRGLFCPSYCAVSQTISAALAGLLVGPIPWGHSGPLCHALSLSSSSSWTSMRKRCATRQ